MPKNIIDDIEAIQAIDVVPTILDVVCRTTGMRFAAIARVTEDRWVTCAALDQIEFGLKPGSELKLQTTICHEIRQSGNAVVIDHVSEDPSYSSHHTPAMYGFQSYISIPIKLRNGTFFGTLCAIDPAPAKLNNTQTIGMFNLYADLISLHIHQLDILKETQQHLAEERRLSELREQFIAILGHDLRNPVGAVRNVAQLLQSGKLDETGVKRFAGVLMNSSHRMTGLIENIMDFARGRMGSGIVVQKREEPLKIILNHVIDELQVIWPNRVIQATFDLPKTLNCDGKRIAQLFSNLLSNALSHGDAELPVFVQAEIQSSNLILSVRNSGMPIPKEIIGRLFEPFARGPNGQTSEGLGLGLFISSEIARAHNGAITVESDETATEFCLAMPVDSQQA